MKYGEEYFKNRKAVKEISQQIEANTISLSELKEIHISKSQIDKWEKEGKIYAIMDGSKKLYSKLRIAELLKK